jgi:hypothetical protein
MASTWIVAAFASNVPDTLTFRPAKASAALVLLST